MPAVSFVPVMIRIELTHAHTVPRLPNPDAMPPGPPPGITLATELFLIFNLLTFTTGLAALYLSTLVQGYIGSCEEATERKKLCRAFGSLGTITFVLTQISLFSLFGVFGVLGYAKFYPHQIHTVIVACAGLFITIWGMIEVHQAVTVVSMDADAKKYDDGAAECCQGSSKDTGVPPVETHHSERTLKQLGTYGPRALFFGSFSYNALVFMYEFERPTSQAYVVLMGISFMSALAINSWSSAFVVTLGSLKTHAQKEQFTQLLLEVRMRCPLCLVPVMIRIELTHAHIVPS